MPDTTQTRGAFQVREVARSFGPERKAGHMPVARYATDTQIAMTAAARSTSAANVAGSALLDLRRNDWETGFLLIAGLFFRVLSRR